MSSTEIAPAPFTDGPEHIHLRSFAGIWSGTTSLWLDPPNPPTETATTARGESLLGGRFVRIDYQGIAMGTPHTGQYLLAYERDDHRFTVAWIDSFHTGTAMMISTAPALTNDSLSVLGSYAAGDTRWGWRTTFGLEAGQLVIAAFNISPAGDEDRAFEIRLSPA